MENAAKDVMRDAGTDTTNAVEEEGKNKTWNALSVSGFAFLILLLSHKFVKR